MIYNNLICAHFFKTPSSRLSYEALLSGGNKTMLSLWTLHSSEKRLDVAVVKGESMRVMLSAEHKTEVVCVWGGGGFQRMCQRDEIPCSWGCTWPC